MSNVGDSMAVEFPPEVTNIFGALRDFVMMEFLGLPGIACLFGQSYFKKFAAGMAMVRHWPRAGTRPGS